MKIYESEQGTEQWLLERAGHFTASPALDLFSGKSTATFQNLINNIIFERFTGKTVDGYKSQSMQDGNDREPLARESFENETFAKVREVGFCEVSEYIGMSSDGFIGKDGLIEIKCPKHTTQVGALISKKVPKRYYYQMQFQMMVSQRKFCWFYSWHPDLPSFKVKVERDKKVIIEIAKELKASIKLVKERLTKLKA